MTTIDRLQILLDERSAALARRDVTAATKTAKDPYLVCASGAERLGLKLSEVASVLPGRSWTALPNAPTGLLGIVALSGQIVTVLDLGVVLGLVPSGTDLQAGHLVRHRQQKPAVALAVERVLGIVEVDPTRLRKPGWQEGEATGLGGAGISGYAPPGCAEGSEFSESFAVVDLPHVLMRFAS